MYFIILGAGEVGLNVAQVLSNEGHEVVLLEKDQERAHRIYNKIDCRIIIDEGARKNVLLEADIARADYFIAATNSDEVNLLSCVLVKNLAPNVINIVRLRSIEYMKNTDEIESTFAADFVVHPERAAALSIIRSIEYGAGASDVFTFKYFGNMMMRNYFVDKDSLLVGTVLKEISEVLSIPQNLKHRFLFSLINRKGETIIPTGSTVFQESDELFVIGEKEVLDTLFAHLGKTVKDAKSVRKVFVIGASAVAEQIIDCYYNTKHSKLSSIIGKSKFVNREITVIDEDITRCEALIKKYENITVLHADIADEDILEDLDITNVDMLIATTESQEKNIVFAAHSHNLGVPHTISLVRTSVYFNIAAELGIGMSLSVRGAVVSSILGFLRGDALLYHLGDGSYGIFECEVHAESRVVYKAINAITLPAKCLILCVKGSHQSKKNMKSITRIAHGNTILEPNARLLCVSHPDSIEKLQNLFSSKKILSIHS